MAKLLRSSQCVRVLSGVGFENGARLLQMSGSLFADGLGKGVKVKKLSVSTLNQVSMKHLNHQT